MSLKLTLHKKAFDVMVTGEKNIEYRNPSKWIKSRLFNKDKQKKFYNFIEFTNGYGKDKPYFKAKYNNFYISNDINKTYSNGLKIIRKEDTYCIKIGQIIKIQNYTLN